MGTTLDTGTKSSAPPALKLRNIGDAVKFAVVDIATDLPMTVYGSKTNEPLLNSRGQQKTQHALTVLVLDPMQAVISDGDGGDLPASRDELHTIYISGYTKYDPDRDKVTEPFLSWGGAVDKVGLEVGHMGMWKYLDDVQGGGTFPRKDRKFQMRAAKPEESDVVNRCEALHAERKADATAAAYVDGGVDEPEVEPF